MLFFGHPPKPHVPIGRSWWQWTQAADANDNAALQRLENRLNMEEIAHFRAFVAAQSSRLLTVSETHLQHAVDAVDAVVANLGKIACNQHLSGCIEMCTGPVHVAAICCHCYQARSPVTIHS